MKQVAEIIWLTIHHDYSGVRVPDKECDMALDPETESVQLLEGGSEPPYQRPGFVPHLRRVLPGPAGLAP